MPRVNTECTELSVGFGLLGIDPLKLPLSQINAHFDDPIDAATHQKFCAEFTSKQKSYLKFYNLGQKLRSSYSLFSNSRFQKIKWSGPRRQANTSSIPEDLLVANVPISIKDQSDIMGNVSLHSLFTTLPQGISKHTRSPNWFLANDEPRYQAAYLFARNTWQPSFPENVQDYHKSIKGKAREILGDILSKEYKKKKKTPEYLKFHHEFYVPLCHSVATKSAEMFNQHLQFSLKSPARSSVIENIIKNFFRIGDSSYIHCGIEKRKEYAILIPGITEWKKNWQFKNLVAVPDVSPTRQQSVVKFFLEIEEKKAPRRVFKAEFYTEIRWSHGKFEGGPEAKSKKMFLWNDVPFVGKLINIRRFEKIKSIGAGNFGEVYQAIDNESGQLVAIKQLITTIAPFQDHELERFEREIKLQSELQHENILPIIAYDMSISNPWFVTPLAKSSLSDLYESAPDIILDRQRINNMYSQILAGMQYAHSKKVIHRDLKPDNILVFDNNLVKVGDFGLGKHCDPNSSTWGLTGSGESLGTFFYIAPEQLESSRDVDFRADIFSLGKLLYYCLTGETPSNTSNLDRIGHQYKSIILKCTALDPDERFQSIDILLETFMNTVCKSSDEESLTQSFLEFE